MPQDRSGANTQVAPVGRRLCGISIPRVSLRSALGYVLATHSGCLPWQYARGQVFILVYRLAMDAKTRKGDGVGG